MSDIAEIISIDGEVLSSSNFGSQKEFEFKILNSLNFDSIKSFFIKKTIIEAIKNKHNSSNGSNGVTSVDLLGLFKWENIQSYLDELEQKKIIQKKQGINSDMYFVHKK